MQQVLQFSWRKLRIFKVFCWKNVGNFTIHLICLLSDLRKSFETFNFNRKKKPSLKRQKRIDTEIILVCLQQTSSNYSNQPTISINSHHPCPNFHLTFPHQKCKSPFFSLSLQFTCLTRARVPKAVQEENDDKRRRRRGKKKLRLSLIWIFFLLSWHKRKTQKKRISIANFISWCSQMLEEFHELFA